MASGAADVADLNIMHIFCFPNMNNSFSFIDSIRSKVFPGHKSMGFIIFLDYFIKFLLIFQFLLVLFSFDHEVFINILYLVELAPY